jgi:hypothetical protein
MDTKSKILFGAFSLLIVLSVSASYYRYMVLHDYLVQAEVDCDPTYESCFVWECDPEEEECTGDPEEDTWYYKFAYRNAKNVPSCEQTSETCDLFTCPEGGEEECREVLCSADALLEYHVDTPCTLLEDFADELILEDEMGEEVVDEELTEDEAVPEEEEALSEEESADTLENVEENTQEEPTTTE